MFDEAASKMVTASDEPNMVLFPGPGRRATLDLPAPLTSLLGRERESNELRALLGQDHIRLITLTGPGGVGKTRLALHVASEASWEFPDGIALIALASVRDPGLVMPTIARSLGIPESDERSLPGRLAAALRDDRLLIVLDNVEQVISAGPAIAALLTHCPDLTIMATSREIMHLSGEHEYHVQPLALPDASRPVASIAETASVQLFVERAAAVQPGFTLDETNTPIVRAICTRLDGLPLAIELAAARLRHLSPTALLNRLTNRLQLLTTGPRDLPARHQTLRQTITWSYDLLTPDERSLFRRLSIFAGGFSLEAAEAVCGPQAGGGAPSGSREAGGTKDDPPVLPFSRSPVPEPSVLDGIASLIDKSLLTQVEDLDGETRYAFLETIREFALVQLAASDEFAGIRGGHAEWCVDLAQHANRVLTGPDRAALLRRLEREQANIREALTWAEESGDAETGLRLVAAVAAFWEARGALSEGADWAGRMLAIPGGETSPTRAATLRGAASLAYRQGAYTRATTLAEAALELARASGDDLNAAAALLVLGNVTYDHGDLDETVARYEEALTLSRAAGDENGIVDALNKAGLALAGLGELDRATVVLDEALARGRQMNSQYWIMSAVGWLGFVNHRRGHLAAAAAYGEEALALQRELNPLAAAATLRSLGLIARDAGDHARAAARFRESLAMRWHWGERRAVAESLASIANLAVAAGHSEPATRLFGGIDSLRQVIGAPAYRWEQGQHDHAMTAARRQLGEDAYTTAFSTGQVLPLADVVALADSIVRAIEQPAEPDQAVPDPAQVTITGLTPREVEVLRLLAEGRSDRQIGEALFISPRTVARHLQSIYNKLDVAGRTAATAYAHRHGLA